MSACSEKTFAARTLPSVASKLFVFIFGNRVGDINSADRTERRFDGGGLQFAEPFEIRSRAANIADELRKINPKIFKSQKFGNRFAVQIVSRTFAVNASR